MDEKAKHREHIRKIWTRKSWKKNVFWRTCEIFKNVQPLTKTKSAKNTPPNAIFRPWECFFRIPHAFLILLAGFSSNFAKPGRFRAMFLFLDVLVQLSCNKTFTFSSSYGMTYSTAELLVKDIWNEKQTLATPFQVSRACCTSS